MIPRDRRTCRPSLSCTVNLCIAYSKKHRALFVKPKNMSKLAVACLMCNRPRSSIVWCGGCKHAPACLLICLLTGMVGWLRRAERISFWIARVVSENHTISLALFVYGSKPRALHHPTLPHWSAVQFKQPRGSCSLVRDPVCTLPRASIPISNSGHLRTLLPIYAQWRCGKMISQDSFSSLSIAPNQSRVHGAVREKYCEKVSNPKSGLLSLHNISDISCSNYVGSICVQLLMLKCPSDCQVLLFPNSVADGEVYAGQNVYVSG